MNLATASRCEDCTHVGFSAWPGGRRSALAGDQFASSLFGVPPSSRKAVGALRRLERAALADHGGVGGAHGAIFVPGRFEDNIRDIAPYAAERGRVGPVRVFRRVAGKPDLVPPSPKLHHNRGHNAPLAAKVAEAKTLDSFPDGLRTRHLAPFLPHRTNTELLRLCTAHKTATGERG